MNKKLISKCCRSEIVEKRDGIVVSNVCSSCGKYCEFAYSDLSKEQKDKINTECCEKANDEQLNLIPQPIQKEEESRDLKFLKEMRGYSKKLLNGNDIVSLEMLDKMIEDWIDELENKTPTPSDTFIEGQVKKFRKQFPEIGTMEQEINGIDSPIFVECEDEAVDFLKSSLQSQRQSILEEVEKKKIKQDGIEADEHDKFVFGYNQALEDIKQII